MRILVFHGYLLRGTGSNVYNAELARALARAGHEVHLLCQDQRPSELAFVDAVGEWEEGVLAVRDLGRERPTDWGRCTVYRPPIGRVLPVYVADRYEGFDALTFDRLDDVALDRYLDANVAAVAEVAALAGVEAALANHLVMGPVILARGLPAAVPYAVKIHGSALEYTVRPHPRFLPHAREGLAPARTVLVGSLHTARRLWDTLDGDPSLAERTFLGPPGVDVEAFRPRSGLEVAAGLAQLESELDARDRRGYGPAQARALDAVFARLDAGDSTTAELAQPLIDLRRTYDPSGIDELAPDAAAAVAAHVEAERPLIVYVGKLIASKGVELLLAALPLVTAWVPDVRLAVAGFGGFREGLELLARALAAGRLDLAAGLATAGRNLEGGEAAELPQLAAFLRSLEGAEADKYRLAAADLDARIEWFGRIEHDLLVHLVPAAAAQVVPSTFPEAFGMVAAEAAACGVPPVCAHHSGLAEVTDQLAEELSSADAGLLSFDTGDTAVRELAERLIELLSDDDRRVAIGARAAAVASERFSWDGVANGVVAAARGEHGPLHRPA